MYVYFGEKKKKLTKKKVFDYKLSFEKNHKTSETLHEYNWRMG